MHLPIQKLQVLNTIFSNVLQDETKLKHKY